MMNTVWHMSCRLVCALAVGGCASVHAAPIYDCHKLDTGTYGYATVSAINTAGETAGYSDFGSSRRNAAQWSISGKATELDDLIPERTGYAWANGINDLGTVVGYSWTGIYTNYVPVKWEGTTPVALPLLPDHQVGYAHDINADGVIVGSSGAEKYGTTRAVMWRKGRVIDLGTLGQTSLGNSANAINRKGVIVGRSDTETPGIYHATWWDTTRQIHDLGTLPGGQNSLATAVNDQGIIVGYGDFGVGDLFHAVAWIDGMAHDLGTLPGHEASRAYGINRAGTVVGMGEIGGDSRTRVALVWHRLHRAPRDLNQASNCGVYRLTSASGINRDGVIAATGEYVDGLGGLHYGAFKLVPVSPAAAAR